MNTLPRSAKNLIKIGSVVSEIWPHNFKSQGAFIQAGAFIRENMVTGAQPACTHQTNVNQDNEFMRLQHAFIITGC